MGAYSFWTRKGDYEDDEEKVTTPFAKFVGHGNMSQQRKLYNVVCGIVSDGKRYLCTRKGETPYSYTSFKWEFPGGKVEEGETEQQALRRELMEELDMDVEVLDCLAVVRHDYPDFSITIAAYRCKASNTNAVAKEHSEICWLDKQEMLSLDWCEADRKLLRYVE